MKKILIEIRVDENDAGERVIWTLRGLLDRLYGEQLEGSDRIILFDSKKNKCGYFEWKSGIK
jgi:hypothetical protein